MGRLMLANWPPLALFQVQTAWAGCRVLVENFKPGTLEGWGLGWDALHALNPKLIMLRISGFGQTGPYAGKPGFGVLGEAMGGLRHLTAEPGRVPVRVGVSIGDTLAALHGVLGVLLALRHRDVNGGQGQMIDVALYESVFNVMESLLPEYDAFGAVRGAAGSALPGIAPSNAYACAGGAYVLVAGNGDSIFRRLMQAIGRNDLATDPELARNDGRVKRVDQIDAAIGTWTATRPIDEVISDAGSRRRAGGPHLHRGRHCRRPAVPGARHDRADARRGRSPVEGAGHRAQAGRHAGPAAQPCAAPGPAHRQRAGRRGLARPARGQRRRAGLSADPASPRHAAWTCREHGRSGPQKS
jgi:crotonobetainyl-CoA:carnitine CoA-transferase CaiB-like acyl-CoA transferase